MSHRRAITVSGVVQGVGFRPYVHTLASRLHLSGFVRNRNGEVQIEVEGEAGALDRFMDELQTRPPPLARIESIQCQASTARGDRDFSILASDASSAGARRICADVATCDDCLAELFDPADRRHRYPFINCTNCGPRLTIITGAPYDRARTTMASFPMCEGCRREYEDPRNRRFHAQPVACAACGPALSLLAADGRPIFAPPLGAPGASDAGDTALRSAAQALLDGRIVAVKGLGGFHLACLATDSAAVAALRKRKHRDEKPFAVMLNDADSAAAVCEVDEASRLLLQSPERPIVLLKKRINDGDIVPDVAPGNPFLGVMLPYTPVHHLLMHALQGRPLVMTSGNRSDEPIAYENADAVSRLSSIADLFLMSNRDIHVRCDDSVARISSGRIVHLRRSRGCAPQPLALPAQCDEPVLAVGGQLKSTFALGLGRQALVSHHLGDLDDYAAFRAFQRDIGIYEGLFAAAPRVFVHDLHPDYASTRYAVSRAQREGARCIAVQHHHAHMASCMAEHRLAQRVIGVCFDGAGYGTDGTIWGGEFLLGDCAGFERAAHLRPVPMPGGDAAVHEPWRMALSHLRDAGADSAAIEKRAGLPRAAAVRAMLERNFNCPVTSSMGRLFDAIACIAGVRGTVSYEAQAAQQLQWLAAQSHDGGEYPCVLDSGNVIDTRPIVAAAAEDARRGVDPPVIARRFHTTVAALISHVCEKIRSASGVNNVVLTGGVFLNDLLAADALQNLARRGFIVHTHGAVPANDGGLSVGQLLVGFYALRRGDGRA